MIVTDREYIEYTVRPDEDGLGSIYTHPKLIGYRVLLVPLELIDEPWVAEARAET